MSNVACNSYVHERLLKINDFLSEGRIFLAKEELEALIKYVQEINHASTRT